MNLDLEKIEQKRNKTLLFLGLLGVASGFIDALLYDNQKLLEISSIVSSLIAIALIYFWIIYDAKIHRYRIPKYIKYLVILFSVIGVPIYFWKTRKFSNFILNIGGLWLFAFYGLLYLLSAYITGSIFN
ncbi:hypothetical protein I4641_21215 [Waterburya agarophytonicola K14]|uniref:Uncharacterized protein n=1 Tax=Waterburya agarophytonicola KI4 TaxID=2874699 RepID=A0A964BWL4_9CYAN|nr:hypothetical protein [Waterburya agarophytonicola]MCC0179483.1 hypothetical protein [Waterburya agarophytonicola KI4]